MHTVQSARAQHSSVRSTERRTTSIARRRSRLAAATPDASALLAFGSEVFAYGLLSDPTSDTQSEASTRLASPTMSNSPTTSSGKGSPPPLAAAVAANAALVAPAASLPALAEPPVRAPVTRTSVLRAHALAERRESNIVLPLPSVVATAIIPRPAPKASAPRTAKLAAFHAPVAPPREAEFVVTKRGVPWRGSYPRLLRVGDGHVVTLDPASRRETNVWQVARGDIFKAWAERESTACFIHLAVAPWPGAPAFTAQRISLAASQQTAEVVLTTLADAGVVVDARTW